MWWGQLQKGHQGVFAPAALSTLLTVRSHCQPHTNAICWDGCWGRLGTMLEAHPCVQSLSRGLNQQPLPPRQGQAHAHSWLPPQLSHTTGCFFLVALAKSGDLPCPGRAAGQLLRISVCASQKGALLALRLELLQAGEGARHTGGERQPCISVI